MELVSILFVSAFVINIISAVYANQIRKTMQGGSLQRVALAAALSALVFGIHHLGESIFVGGNLVAIAEGTEAISGLLLIWAIYEFYQTIKV